MLPAGTRVVRVMPNTPALVQAGATVYSPGTNAKPEDSELADKLFSGVGICSGLPERYMDAVTALSGAGPAYVSTLLFRPEARIITDVKHKSISVVSALVQVWF